jgi:hypothetical protein
MMMMRRRRRTMMMPMMLVMMISGLLDYDPHDIGPSPPWPLTAWLLQLNICGPQKQPPKLPLEKITPATCGCWAAVRKKDIHHAKGWGFTQPGNGDLMGFDQPGDSILKHRDLTSEK